jgi:hypothetical protein
MRKFGQILIVLGLAGFFYASSSGQGAPEAGASVSAALSSPAGRLELLRYASATAAFIGILLALFPKGR